VSRAIGSFEKIESLCEFTKLLEATTLPR